jgi:hypothetical protein
MAKKTYEVTIRDANGEDTTIEIQGTRAEVPGRGILQIFDGDEPVAGYVSVVGWRTKA